ncbi:MAG: PDZ domain-containing protein [Armatimonadetes bacterium]|nr:PDZ domain-containing protein [Armatimonadota bacterium]
MLSLAVKAGLALLAMGQQQAAVVDPAWVRVRSSVVRIDAVGQNPGLGVLIDSRGYFLTHKDSTNIRPLMGRYGDNQAVLLTVVAVDDQTQLALLRAENWVSTGQGGVQVAAKTAPGAPLLAVTAVGPVKGEFVSDEKVGQMRPSLRYAPLSEIRLESNVVPIGGALVFDAQGALVGVLGATLSSNNQTSSPGKAVAAQKSTLASADSVELTGKRSQYGPQGMTVAYSLGPAVLDRVVKGFLSPEHKVKHPSVGLFFKASAEPGALIEEVLAGGAASLAGIQPGDIVKEADGQVIHNPVEFAIALFNHNVGDKIVLKIKRQGEESEVSVIVGTQD